MKAILLFFSAFMLHFGFTDAFCQPVPLRPDIKVSPFMTIPKGCSRMAMDPVSRNIFFVNTSGDVYVIKKVSGVYTNALKYKAADHGIPFVQGMAFNGKSLFLIGNINLQDSAYVGKIVRGDLLDGGGRKWTTVLTTQPYGLTNTAFDHGFNGMTVSPDAQYLYFTSGSRSDHGEIQSNGGIRPGLREEPITSAVFRVPIGTQNLVLPNDSTLLASNGYLFADGTRNTFDIAFGPDGNLYGCENSGDRDDPEELNWIRQNNFYGFPWVMGGDNTPMQYPGYDPSKDKLVNPISTAAQKGYFYNDPAYPARPDRPFTSAIVNLGPDADKFRDPVTGAIKDASDLGVEITTFTSHRSPCGLVFDTQNALSDEFKGHGFLLGWTSKASSTNLGPFGDSGEDLLHIQLIYDAKKDNYKIQTHKIVEGFHNPIDAVMDGNVIYVMEYGGSSPKIYKIELPSNPSCASSSYIVRQKWSNIPGGKISDLTNDPDYPNRPSYIKELSSFEAPINAGESFGDRIQAYIHPPVTGYYTFWVAGDDQAELWLSTDSTSTNRKKIAFANSYTQSRQYNKFSTQKSARVRLVAGKKYYIEGLHKEDTGGDNFSVQWMLPDSTIEVPIPCTRLSRFQTMPTINSFAVNEDGLSFLKNQEVLPAGLKVFPNPAHEAVNVEFNVADENNCVITITDLMGLQHYKEERRLNAGDNHLNVNTSHLGKGIYILNVKSGERQYDAKIVIQ